MSSDGYDVSVGQQGGVSSNGLQVIVSADDAAVVESTTEAVRSALAGEASLANLASDLVKAAPEIQVRVDPTKALAIGMTAAQVGTQIRSALVPTTIGRVTLGEEAPVALVVRLDPESLGSVSELGALQVGMTTQVPLEHGRDRQPGRRPGSHHADRSKPVRHDHRRDHERRYGRDVRRRGGAHRASARLRGDPVGRRCPARRRDRAAGRGLRRTVRGDGCRDPARLPRDGRGLQLARHAVHHPVQPAAGHDRRIPGAARHRPADRALGASSAS